MSVGTCTVPSTLSPSVDKLTASEMAGIVSSTGVECAVASGIAVFAGTALAFAAAGRPERWRRPGQSMLMLLQTDDDAC